MRDDIEFSYPNYEVPDFFYDLQAPGPIPPCQSVPPPPPPKKEWKIKIQK